MAMYQQRPMLASGPRRSVDRSLGLAIPRAPWEHHNIAQVPFTDSTSPQLSTAERNALPYLWAARANHNLAVNSPSKHSARTPISATQTWSTNRTPLSSTTPATATTWSSGRTPLSTTTPVTATTWSSCRTPLSTITPGTATTWSSHWSPAIPETKTCPWPADKPTEKPLPTVPATPRLQWTPYFSPVGLPSSPRPTTAVASPYASAPASSEHLVRPVLVPMESSDRRLLTPVPGTMSSRGAPPPQRPPQQLYEVYEPDETPTRSLRKRIRSFFKTIFHRKHADEADLIFIHDDNHWSEQDC